MGLAKESKDGKAPGRVLRSDRRVRSGQFVIEEFTGGPPVLQLPVQFWSHSDLAVVRAENK